MEYVKMGDRLQTLIKWHTMDERPNESGDYLIIWHSPTGRYAVKSYMYSKKYDLWGTYDEVEGGARGAVAMAERGYSKDNESHLCGWYKQDFTECFEDDGGEF